MAQALWDRAGPARETGYVFEIQHFSIHDGPGIRSTVFLRGCPLNCVWCHNPEGRSPDRAVVLESQRCRQCGACVRACPRGAHSIRDGQHRFDAGRCTGCGQCVESCPYGAMRWLGSAMEAGTVLEEIARDIPYFQASGGGMTLSGGEPAQQPGFSLALLRLAGTRGIHRAVETCGYAPWEVYAAFLPCTDLFLFDCKETDPERHLRFTGVEPALILENLRKLHDSGARILLRCPIIPGCNDRDDHFAALARLCADLPRLTGIELLPYHSLGVSKASRLGLDEQARFETPSGERVAQWNDRLRSLGAPVVP